ncbi:MAG: hypothetical protein AAB955_00795 [Patescibacteria group bacterium]
MGYIVALCIFFGEVLVIYSEQIGARLYGVQAATFGTAFLYAIAPAIMGAALLVVGYMLGVKYHQNVWAVTALSLSSILIVEPLFNYFYIGHIPELGSALGFVFGALGILAVTFL